jgi:hypothetical protein
LPGFPGHAAEAFCEEVKKARPCGDWLGVHREDGTYRTKKVWRKACKKQKSASSAAPDPNSHAPFSKLNSREQKGVVKGAEAGTGMGGYVACLPGHGVLHYST